MAFLASLLIFSQGCSTASKSGDNATVTEEVQYNGQCALGVAHGDCNVKGESRWKVVYKHKVYYFASEDKKDQFMANLDTNIKKANGAWQKHLGTK